MSSRLTQMRALRALILLFALGASGCQTALHLKDGRVVEGDFIRVEERTQAIVMEAEDGRRTTYRRAEIIDASAAANGVVITGSVLIGVSLPVLIWGAVLTAQGEQAPLYTIKDSLLGVGGGGLALGAFLLGAGLYEVFRTQRVLTEHLDTDDDTRRWGVSLWLSPSNRGDGTEGMGVLRFSF